MLFGVRGTGGWGECLLGTGPLTISARACIRWPSGRGRIVPVRMRWSQAGDGSAYLRLGRIHTTALSVLECRGAQSKRKTTRHRSSGTNQDEPRWRKP